MDRDHAAAGGRRLRRRIRGILLFFIIGLALSGATAIPLRWEVDLLARAFPRPTAAAGSVPGLAAWIARVREGLHATYARYPFIAYGTDWLAFAHFLLAILFVGPLVDPVRNRWVLTFGMIACVLVIPWALVLGAVRGIPLGWRLVDCLFGVFGVIPLWLARRWAVEWGRSDAGS